MSAYYAEQAQLKIIKENNKLPEEYEGKYQDYWHRSQEETLTPEESKEYLAMIRVTEEKHLKVLQAVVNLAQIRGETFTDLYRELKAKGVIKQII